MRNRTLFPSCLPSVLSLTLVAFAALMPASGQAAVGPDTDPASNPVQKTVPAVFTRNGNVRYGPDQKAKPVVMLKAESPVEVIGAALGAPDWLVIRFPKEGKAWVREDKITAIDEGKRWRVIRDRSNARDDATLGANIVAQLAVGEVLEDKGQKVGNWVAVYIPNAIAYTHKDNVRLATTPPAAGQTATTTTDVVAAVKTVSEENRKQTEESERVWAAAVSTYGDFRDSVTARLEVALNKDWDGLERQLAEVIEKHPSTATRLAAQQIKVAIDKVKTEAKAYALAKNLEIKVTDPVKEPGKVPTTTHTGPAISGSVPGANPGVAALPVKVAVSPYAADGLLVQKDLTALDIHYAIMDGDGNVKAYLKAKDPATLQLSEYYYRNVGVKGNKDPIDAAKAGLANPAPLVTVEEVVLLGR